MKIQKEQPAQRWISVGERLPEKRNSYRDPAPYVLAVDSRGRMSVAYCDKHSSGHAWVMAKPIGKVTHWMPLPEPPSEDVSVQAQENATTK